MRGPRRINFVMQLRLVNTYNDDRHCLAEVFNPPRITIPSETISKFPVKIHNDLMENLIYVYYEIGRAHV